MERRLRRMARRASLRRSAEPYVALAYDGEDPFDEDQFADLAETLLLPLLDAEGRPGR